MNMDVSVDNEKSGEKQIPITCPNVSRKISLNSKCKMFVEHYLTNNSNGTIAARLSGYKSPVNASQRLLSNPIIRSYIEQRTEENARQIQLSRPQFLHKLARLEEQLRKAGRLGDLVKLANLEAQVLGHTKEQGTTNVNVFSSLDQALAMFEGKLNTIDVPTTESGKVT